MRIADPSKRKVMENSGTRYVFHNSVSVFPLTCLPCYCQFTSEQMTVENMKQAVLKYSKNKQKM